MAVAEFQQAVLDIHTLIDYIDVYQTHLHPDPNGIEKHELNQDLMGAFMEKVTVAQQIRLMGILIWLIQPSFHILPTMNVNMPPLQQHCDEIVLHYFADGLESPDLYPVLAVGPPSTKL